MGPCQPRKSCVGQKGHWQQVPLPCWGKMMSMTLVKTVVSSYYDKKRTSSQLFIHLEEEEKKMHE